MGRYDVSGKIHVVMTTSGVVFGDSELTIKWCVLQSFLVQFNAVILINCIATISESTTFRGFSYSNRHFTMWGG